MSELPSGTVTFLFTDIEGSTRLLQQLGADLYGQVLSDQRSILREAFDTYNGTEIDTQGDAFFASFPRATGAVAGAVQIQRALAEHDWPESVELRVRMGLHTGEPWLIEEGYVGMDVHRAARIATVGHGGQVLLSETTMPLVQNELPAGVTLLDLGRHRLKDMHRPESLHQLVIAGLPSEFPQLSSLSVRPNNLPPQTTPFIGRQQELADIKDLLDKECRVLTVLGPGGMGKTRLGLQVAAEQIDTYRHGVYFVPLAPLKSSDAIVSTIANELRYPFTSSGDPQDQLVNYLQSKQMLLVMDNFEHVADGASIIAEIVKRAPDVQVIATSRARLNMSIECVYEVGGMRVPANEQDEVFGRSDAVEMFMDYARRVKPDFKLLDKDRAAVVKLCQLVNGMPLAIELAAAWTRMLRPSEITEHLEEDLDFLAAERADMPARQRSMRATYNHSLKMLSQVEQDALMKLSIFRGGFSRPAGRTVTGASLITMMGLVDKSLVKWHAGAMRYEVHELIRQFAEQDLKESGQTDEIKNRHSKYYLNSLSHKAKELKGEAQLDALDDIPSDFENVRAAWKWGVTQGSWQLLDKAAESLYLFLRMRKRPGDGGDLFGSVRSALANRQDTDAQLIWARMTSFLYALGEQSAAHFKTQQRVLESALLFTQHHGTKTDQAHCYQALAYLADSKPDWERALDYARQSLKAYEAVEDPFYVGRLHADVGYFSVWVEEDITPYAHRLESYREMHQRALEIAQMINDAVGITRAASNLGWSDVVNFGDYEQATEHAQLAITHTRELDPIGIGHNNILLGLLELLGGELERSREHLMLGEKTAREFNYQLSLAYALGIRAALESVEEKYQIAIKLAEESRQAKTNPIGDALGHWGMAMACIGLQEFDLARNAVLEGLAIEFSSNNIIGLDLLACAAVLLHKDGLAERAVEVLSLSFNEPRSAKGWKQKWRVITDLKASLNEAVGDGIYLAAWERGKTLDLPTVVGELIEHFGV